VHELSGANQQCRGGTGSDQEPNPEALHRPAGSGSMKHWKHTNHLIQLKQTPRIKMMLDDYLRSDLQMNDLMMLHPPKDSRIDD